MSSIAGADIDGSQKSIHRRPGLEPGPITTGDRDVARWSLSSFFNNVHSGEWVPAHVPRLPSRCELPQSLASWIQPIFQELDRLPVHLCRRGATRDQAGLASRWRYLRLIVGKRREWREDTVRSQALYDVGDRRRLLRHIK